MTNQTVRHVPAGGGTVEVMNRTFQERRLLRPGPEVNQAIVGILSRAVRRYRVQIVSFTVLSDHYHGILRVPDAKELAGFMCYIDSNIAREVGRIHDWDGKFWAGRYEMVLISDEEQAQAKRLKYVLSQGVKEGFVARPEHWPGLHCASALISGTPTHGIWYDRTKEYNLGRSKPRRLRQTFPEHHWLAYAKLPAWSHLSDQEYQEAVQGLIDEIVVEGEAMRRAEGIVLRPLKEQQRWICSVDPHSRPKQSKKSTVQRFIAATREAREKMIEAYRLFVEAYRAAADELRKGNRNARFPVGCFPPGLPFVRDETGLAARSP